MLYSTCTNLQTLPLSCTLVSCITDLDYDDVNNSQVLGKLFYKKNNM